MKDIDSVSIVKRIVYSPHGTGIKYNPATSDCICPKNQFTNDSEIAPHVQVISKVKDALCAKSINSLALLQEEYPPEHPPKIIQYTRQVDLS